MTQESGLGFSKRDLFEAGYEPKGPGKNSFSGHERNHLFINGGDRFHDVQLVSGLDSAADGRSFATLDMDHDGLTDIALVNANEPGFQLFRNRLRERGAVGQHLAVRFVGGARAGREQGWSNRDGYGTQVVVTAGGREILREHRAGEGMGAQNSATILVGLGDASHAEQIEVRWPSGKRQQTSGVAAGSVLWVYEDEKASPSGESFVIGPYQRARPSDAVAVSSGEVIDVPTELVPAEGKVAALVTMATWCVSCTKKIPDLRALASAFPDGEVALYGLPVDEEDDDAKLDRYEQAHAPPYRILRSTPRSTVDDLKDQIVKRLGYDALPSTLIINASRQVLLVRGGVPTVSDMKRALH